MAREIRTPGGQFISPERLRELTTDLRPVPSPAAGAALDRLERITRALSRLDGALRDASRPDHEAAIATVNRMWFAKHKQKPETVALMALVDAIDIAARPSNPSEPIERRCARAVESFLRFFPEYKITPAALQPVVETWGSRFKWKNLYQLAKQGRLRPPAPKTIKDQWRAWRRDAWD